MEELSDEIEQCPDGSDENYQIKKRIKCGQCDVTINRLTNVSECNLNFSISCDNSFCYNVSSLLCSTIDCNVSDLICISNCSVNSTKPCNRGFQCDDGSLGLTHQLCNGKFDCHDKSDEIQYQQGFKCVPVGSDKKCVLPQRNLHDDVAQCSDESDLCKNNSCFQCFDKRLLISFNQVCDGLFDCFDLSDERLCQIDFKSNFTKHQKRNFQCDDGSLGFTDQLCNKVFDCQDKSDEIQYQQGFKCVALGSAKKCVLPQRNLHDNVPQCSDESDLCKNNSCFKCFDQRLWISSNQVCDGVFDCYDWSDECLCKQHFDSNLCNTRFSSCNMLHKNYKTKHDFNSSLNLDFYRILNVNADMTKSTTRCQTRIEDHRPATVCDGQPECSDLSDECRCENPPRFCNYTCHNGYNIGDRYCDGIKDNFYNITNKSNCFQGFEELNCLKRFACKAGNKLSIHVDQICDGKKDCDDNRDEHDCEGNDTRIFSSDLEMIANLALKSCFWFMSIAVISGNLYVIVSTIKLFRTAKPGKSLNYQHVIIFNISIADIILGFYLLAIAIYSIYYSGHYGDFDLKWRSSVRCSIIGSLAVLSSEASCLFMVLLTGSRLYAIHKPFSILSISTRKYKLAIISVWLMSVVIAILPILHGVSDYFVHSVEFSNRFVRSQTWNKEKIIEFACRLAEMNNQSMKYNDWVFTKSFLKANYPEYSPGVEFGYYGQTSVCMPRFYVYFGEHAWEYSIVIISVNFVCFFFIAVSYIYMFIRSTKNQLKIRNNQIEKTRSKMQGRISRIIITDFLCWIPICIMAYVKFSGFYVDDVAYIVTAGLLLPINSAFNPILYSSLLDKLFEIFKNRKQKPENQHEIVDITILNDSLKR